MKKIFAILIALTVLLSLFSSAQTNQPPTPNNYYSYLLRVKGYADSGSVRYYPYRPADTLAYTYHSTAKYVLTYLPWTSPTFASFTVVMEDTGSVAVKVISRVKGHGFATPRAWSTILEDSMINHDGSADSLAKEFSLKDLDSDLFDGLDQEFAIIVSHQGPWRRADAAGSNRRRVYFNWK